MTENKLSG